MGVGFADTGAEWLGGAANLCFLPLAANDFFDGDAAFLLAQLPGAVAIAVSTAAIASYSTCTLGIGFDLGCARRSFGATTG